MNNTVDVKEAVRDVMIALEFGITDDLADMEVVEDGVQTAERL